MFKKILIAIFICFFIGSINFVDARRVRFSGWGDFTGFAVKHAVMTQFKNPSTTYIPLSSIDKSFCIGNEIDNNYNYDPNIFIVSEFFTFPTSEAEIERLSIDLDNTPVNQYSQSSVNNYNAKVRDLNAKIVQNNAHLEKEWIPLSLYCKPYGCEQKYPGSTFNKLTDHCDLPEKTTSTSFQNLSSSNSTSTASSSYSSTYSSSNDSSDDWVWIIIGIIVLIIVYNFFRKKN